MRRDSRLPTTAAFSLLVSILVAFPAASSAPTPLWSRYQSEWSVSSITVTTVFGVYALALLAALLTVGSLSDHLGRRPVVLAGLALESVAMLVFAAAGGVPALVVARVIQGLATGTALGALGAGLLDVDRRRGTIANGTGALAGIAAGALGSSLLVQYLPAPARLVYLVFFGIFIAQGLGVILIAESSPPTPGAPASLRPPLRLPRSSRRAFAAAVPILLAVWALSGFYASLGPALVRLVVGSDSVVFGGLGLFVLAGTASMTVLLVRTVPPRTVMFLGAVALAVGVGITLPAIARSAAAAFFVGTAVAGVGFGAGLQGALRTVLPLAAPHERAGVLAVIYVVTYVAFSLPVVIAGLLVVHGGGVRRTAREYAVAVIVLAALAMAGLARRPHDEVIDRQTAGRSPQQDDVMARAGCPGA